MQSKSRLISSKALFLPVHEGFFVLDQDFRVCLLGMRTSEDVDQSSLLEKGAEQARRLQFQKKEMGVRWLKPY